MKILHSGDGHYHLGGGGHDHDHEHEHEHSPSYSTKHKGIINEKENKELLEGLLP